MSDLRIKATILGRDKNQSHPISTERTQCKQETPNNYSMEITRAHRVPFSLYTPQTVVGLGISEPSTVVFSHDCVCSFYGVVLPSFGWSIDVIWMVVGHYKPVVFESEGGWLDLVTFPNLKKKCL